MILSMTGFGKGETQFSNKKITVEIRTLNSKNIDLNFRTPHSYRELESSMRGEINKKLVRGKIDVSVFVDNSGSATNTILNKEVIQNYLAQLNDIHQGDTTELLKMAVRLPDALKTEKEAIDEKEKEALLSLFTSTLEKVNQHREDEGLALKKDFSLRLVAIDQLLKDVIAIDPERKERVTEKLTTSLAQLKLEVDQNRLEQELIYYLEKLDINEELVRLKNHLIYFKTTMNESQVEKGKKLTFISQEIGREINTIGSKSNNLLMQQAVVEMKNELEKIKEQLLNVL